MTDMIKAASAYYYVRLQCQNAALNYLVLNLYMDLYGF